MQIFIYGRQLLTWCFRLPFPADVTSQKHEVIFGSCAPYTDKYKPAPFPYDVEGEESAGSFGDGFRFSGKMYLCDGEVGVGEHCGGGGNRGKDEEAKTGGSTSKAPSTVAAPLSMGLVLLLVLLTFKMVC